MNQKELKELMRAFDKSGLSKLKLKDGEFELLFQKGVENSTTQVAPATQIESSPKIELAKQDVVIEKEQTATIDKDEYIKSPMVGTFYQAPSPGAAPFVQVGDIVKSGSTVAIIEAMKIMNEIEAELDCKIVETLVNDGEPVEFDQPLFRIEKI